MRCGFKHILRTLLICMLLAMPIGLFAADDSEQRKDTTFQVALMAYNLEQLQPENQNLARTLEDALYAEMAQVPSYTARTEEQWARADEQYTSHRAVVQSELSALQEEWDLQFLQLTAEEQLELTQKITQKESELTAYNKPELDQYTEPVTWNLSYLWQTEETDQQEPALTANTNKPFPLSVSRKASVLAVVAKELEANALIMIVFQEIQNELWCQIESYNSLTREKRILYGDFVVSDTGVINDRVFVLALRDFLLGDRTWSSLKVHNPVASLRITVAYEETSQSTTYNASDTALQYLLPGEVTITLEGNEYVEVMYNQTLQARETTNISGDLMKTPGVSFYVQIADEATMIYRNEQFFGHGTQIVPDVSLPGTLRLTNGVNEFTFLLQEDANPYQYAEVLDQRIAYTTIRGQREEKFYRSFAFFFLSLPMTFLSREMQSEYRRLESDSIQEKFWGTMFYISLATNVIGGAQFFVDLFRFMDSEDLLYARE